MSFTVLAHNPADRSLEAIPYAICCGFLFLIPIYLLPIIIAQRRQHDKMLEIMVLTLLGGWTGIGWIVALIWALRSR